MKILDTVWMVVCPPNNAGVIYALSQSKESLWEDIEQREVMGTGVDRKFLKKKGYKAKQVQIMLMEAEDVK